MPEYNISISPRVINMGVTGAPMPSEGGASTWDSLTGTANHIPFNIAPTAVPTTLGTMSWNADDGCLEYAVTGGTISVGKEVFDYFTNLSGVTMVDGDIVSVVGASGNRTAVTLTDATNETSSINVIGMVTQGGANNAIVRVTKIGAVHSLNTNELVEGSTIYVNPSQPGKWSSVKPSSPNHIVSIGFVQVANANNGVVDVVPDHQCITSNYIIDATVWDGQTSATDKVVKYGEDGTLSAESIGVFAGDPITNPAATTIFGGGIMQSNAGSGDYVSVLPPTALTANRSIQWPDASGTVLLSDGPLGTPSSGDLRNCTGILKTQSKLGVSTGLSSVGSVDIAGLTGYELEANTWYKLDVQYLWTSTASNFQINFVTTGTFVRGGTTPSLGQSTSAVAVISSTYFLSDTAFALRGNVGDNRVDCPAFGYAYFKTGTAGTGKIQVQLLSGTTLSTITSACAVLTKQQP